MSTADPVLDSYERRLRRSLTGLPRPDVDDIVAEAMSHLREEIGSGRSALEALKAFGAPHIVAAEIVAGRVRPDGETAIAPASPGRRLAAWLADAVIGWGPLVVQPLWMELQAWFIERFVLPPEQMKQLAAESGYQGVDLSPWLFLLAGASVVWGLWYWLGPRRRSASVGMRMAGLSRVRAGDERLVVATEDLAETEPARMVARPKWFLAPPLALIGLIVAVVLLFYGLMAMGSVAFPIGKAADVVEDLTRSDSVCEAFYERIVAADEDGALALVEPAARADASALLERAMRDGVVRAERGMSVDDRSYVMHEYFRDGRPPRTVMLTVSRSEETVDPGSYATVYRISRIETSVPESLE